MYEVVWNRLPKQRLEQIYKHIKYRKFEPLSAERLVDELLAFGDKLGTTAGSHFTLKNLSNKKFTYYTVTYQKFYRFIYRINDKKRQVIITDLFHNRRDPKKLRAG